MGSAIQASCHLGSEPRRPPTQRAGAGVLAFLCLSVFVFNSHHHAGILHMITVWKFVTRSKTAGAQQSGIEATQVPHTRRSGDALSLPGAFSSSRATTQGSHDPHRCLGQLPQASPAISSRRSRPQAVGDRRAARWSPGGEQPRDGDDCGRALRARVSLHTRTASLGLASSYVCEHVCEAPFAASGRRGDHRRVVLLQAAEARRLLSAHQRRLLHNHSCGCCRRNGPTPTATGC